jgi:hypothetical protein
MTINHEIPAEKLAKSVVNRCTRLTPDKIALIEKDFLQLGKNDLAQVAREQGENNCGVAEYAAYYSAAMI